LPFSLAEPFESIHSWSHILYNLNKLRRNTWLSLHELEKMQIKKLKHILQQSYENVSFYHQRFKSANIKPEDIKCTEDLQKVPILTKTEVQNNFDSLIAKGYSIDRCERAETAGSTGVPL